MDAILLIFQLLVLILSVVIHEYSHGAVANVMGDNTAKDEGRLSLNPIKHFDLFGSFLLPLIMYIASSGRFLFGWAKPVPYNPYNFRNRRWGSFWVGLAGPASNLLIALFFGIVLRSFFYLNMLPIDQHPLVDLLNWIVLLNIFLGIFNLVPIPPLDGSRVLFAVLPQSLKYVEDFLEEIGIFVVLLFMIFGFQYLSPLVSFVYSLFTGQPLLY